MEYEELIIKLTEIENKMDILLFKINELLDGGHDD